MPFKNIFALKEDILYLNTGNNEFCVTLSTLSKSDWDTAVEILTTVNIYQIVLMMKFRETDE